MEISVIEGDITTVRSDAILTFVDGSGRWKGGVDEAIRRVAGSAFHDQALPALKGRPERTVLVSEPVANQASFSRVVFVVDNLTGPLYPLVYEGLTQAAEAGISTITMPALRLGQLKNVAGGPDQKVRDLCLATNHALLRCRSLREVRFVILGDRSTANAIRRELARRRFIGECSDVCLLGRRSKGGHSAVPGSGGDLEHPERGQAGRCSGPTLV